MFCKWEFLHDFAKCLRNYICVAACDFVENNAHEYHLCEKSLWMGQFCNASPLSISAGAAEEMFFGQQNSEMCFMHDLKTNRISGFTENVKLEEKNVLCTSRFATHAN